MNNSLRNKLLVGLGVTPTIILGLTLIVSDLHPNEVVETYDCSNLKESQLQILNAVNEQCDNVWEPSFEVAQECKNDNRRAVCNSAVFVVNKDTGESWQINKQEKPAFASN